MPGGPRCQVFYKAGFPLVYYESKKDISFPSEDACFAYLDKHRCVDEQFPIGNVNIFLLIADVLILGIFLAIISILFFYILTSVLKIPFRLSWLFNSISFSIVFNIFTLIPLGFFPISILGIASLILITPLLDLLGIGGSFSLQIFLFIGMPLVLGTFLFYIIIWGINKLKARKTPKG